MIQRAMLQSSRRAWTHMSSSRLSKCMDVASQRPVASIATYPQFAARFLSTETGDDLYQRATQAAEKVKLVQAEKEQERSEKMYEAWQRAEEADKNPKSQGVSVVKTLAKETRKTQKAKEVDEEALLTQQAQEWLEQAAYEHEHPMALVQLGNVALESAGKAKESEAEKQREDVQKALELFLRAGEAGSRVGWYNLGHLLWTGFPVVDDESDSSVGDDQIIISPDLDAAMEAFQKAIVLGDTDAMYLVGVQELALGEKESLLSGLQHIETAADGGHGGALYYLALFYLNGLDKIGIEPCSEAEFVERLDRAVEAGSVDALFSRGHSYYHGTEGYPQNFVRSLHDFLQAADEGHADAAVSAGAMLHSGIGVPRDQRRAFELYQAAGELGSVDGWRNVIACYTRGEGVPQSMETAKYIADTILKDMDENN